MNAAGECLTAIPGPSTGGLPFYDLDWDLALGLAEHLSSFPGSCSAISFLDAGHMLRCLISSAERQAIGRHLVLPTGGILSGLMYRMMGATSGKGRFCAADFLPALLTHVERPMTVAVQHPNIPHAEQLRDRLQWHTPWHRVVLANDTTVDRADVMIVLGSLSGSFEMRDKTVEGMRANLTIFAGIQSLRCGE